MTTVPTALAPAWLCARGCDRCPGGALNRQPRVARCAAGALCPPLRRGLAQAAAVAGGGGNGRLRPGARAGGVPAAGRCRVPRAVREPAGGRSAGRERCR